MTVGDLMEFLENQPADAEVRLACQPRWAFEYSIAGVAGPDEMREHIENEMDDDEDSDPEADMERVKNVVYIGAGVQLGYLPAPGSVAFKRNF